MPCAPIGCFLAQATSLSASNLGVHAGTVLLSLPIFHTELSPMLAAGIAVTLAGASAYAACKAQLSRASFASGWAAAVRRPLSVAAVVLCSFVLFVYFLALCSVVVQRTVLAALAVLFVTAKAYHVVRAQRKWASALRAHDAHERKHATIASPLRRFFRSFYLVDQEASPVARAFMWYTLLALLIGFNVYFLIFESAWAYASIPSLASALYSQGTAGDRGRSSQVTVLSAVA